jgi:hypothetical protein
MEKENINATGGIPIFQLTCTFALRTNFRAIFRLLHGRRHGVFSSCSLKHSLEKTDEMLCVWSEKGEGAVVTDQRVPTHLFAHRVPHSCTPPPLYVYRRCVKYDGREAGGTFTEMRGLSHLQIGNFGTESAENSVK